jgi:hypothetical protein
MKQDMRVAVRSRRLHNLWGRDRERACASQSGKLAFGRAMGETHRPCKMSCGSREGNGRK